MSAPRTRTDLNKALQSLRRCYGRRFNKPEGSAVGELVLTILSQNTSAANYTAGFRQLWRRFRSWKAVANADEAAIERCIRVCGLSRLKAPRIKRILNQIAQLPQAAGRISLEFLAGWDDKAAYELLSSFAGVGPKTAACVLMFAFDKPLFPVDTHIHRIAGRLGWIAPGVSAVTAQARLTELIAPPERYEMHVLLIEHGRTCCRAIGPRCAECVLGRQCPSRKLIG